VYKHRYTQTLIGELRKGDLSRFIEEAMRAYLFRQAVDQTKAAAAGMSETELEDLIDEAVQWARKQ
jgi:hypothetical protein